MKTIYCLEDIRLAGASCAIGMFDGIHAGHQKVLASALHQAHLLHMPSVVFSFANHPQFLLSKTPTRLLSDLDQRLNAFHAMGFDYALMLTFDASLKTMSAQTFIRQILLDHLAVQSVSVGYDHRFGSGREGDEEFLRRSGQRHGFQVHTIPPVRVDDQIVSSTLIRKLLSYGDIEQANRLLGHPYTLNGTVIQGTQRGKDLGFPTANLSVDLNRVLPGIGTYGGLAQLDCQTYRAVCNIGFSPTFGDQPLKRIEVHLLDYPGNPFYGKTLHMAFYQKLRDEQVFSSIEALTQQIQQDCFLIASAPWLPFDWHSADTVAEVSSLGKKLASP